MAIEKSLYQAPLGIEDGMDDDAPELEIEVVNPEMVTLDDGSVEITIIPGEIEDEDIGGMPFDANLAELMDEGDLSQLASDLLADYENDVGSRKD